MQQPSFVYLAGNKQQFYYDVYLICFLYEDQKYIPKIFGCQNTMYYYYCVVFFCLFFIKNQLQS